MCADGATLAQAKIKGSTKDQILTMAAKAGGREKVDNGGTFLICFARALGMQKTDLMEALIVAPGELEDWAVEMAPHELEYLKVHSSCGGVELSGACADPSAKKYMKGWSAELSKIWSVELESGIVMCNRKLYTRLNNESRRYDCAGRVTTVDREDMRGGVAPSLKKNTFCDKCIANRNDQTVANKSVNHRSEDDQIKLLEIAKGIHDKIMASREEAKRSGNPMHVDIGRYPMDINSDQPEKRNGPRREMIRPWTIQPIHATGNCCFFDGCENTHARCVIMLMMQALSNDDVGVGYIRITLYHGARSRNIRLRPEK